MAAVNWRTINVDALDPESTYNFDLDTLRPGIEPISLSDVQKLDNQIKQLSRGGDNQGALLSALENVPYGADEQGKLKELRLSTVVDILQSIRQTDMIPLLQTVYGSERGSELCDTLMKYLYRGMARVPEPSSAKAMTPQQTGFSQIASRAGGGDSHNHAMNVLLSWHEKLVEIAGPGCIARVMSDRRTV